MNSCRISMIPVLLLIIVLLTSCAGVNLYKDELMKLQLGMEKEDVLSLMGPPGLNEAYRSKTGTSLEIFFYGTMYTQSSDCVTAEYEWQKCMPLVFEDGKLIGWGRPLYEGKIKIELDITTIEK